MKVTDIKRIIVACSLLPWKVIMARNTKKTEDYEYRHIPQIMNVNILIGWFFFSALSFGGGVSNNPTINISPTNITVNEGDSGTSTVSLTITASDCPDTSDIKIHWETADGTAKTSNNDYVGASGDVTFSVPGWSDSCDDADKSKRISVTVNGDTQIEPDETFKITISDGGTSSSQNFTIGDSTSTITIKNDDSTPPVAQNDTATTDEDTPVTIDVLANDSDPDGDSLSIESVSDPAHGNAT
ncbi:Ig-like domain-containing protein, partial [Nitratifractor sp.]